MDPCASCVFGSGNVEALKFAAGRNGERAGQAVGDGRYLTRGNGLGQGVGLDARLLTSFLGTRASLSLGVPSKGDELAVHMLVEGLLQAVLVSCGKIEQVE